MTERQSISTYLGSGALPLLTILLCETSKVVTLVLRDHFSRRLHTSGQHKLPGYLAHMLNSVDKPSTQGPAMWSLGRLHLQRLCPVASRRNDTVCKSGLTKGVKEMLNKWLKELSALQLLDK